MFRSLIGAVMVLVMGVGITLAAEIRGVITKVDGNKITFSESNRKGERGPSQTLPLADNVKIVESKFNRDTKKVETGDALKDGLKNEMFSKIGDKGVSATIVTDADNKKITEIRVGGGRKKKDQ